MSTTYEEKNINNLILLESETMDIRRLEEVLKDQSNHIGARHFLVHAFESKNEYKSALLHAEVMAASAPNSAHAQHMLGHILPKVGKWNEAIKQFELADQVHQRWIKENGSNFEEDWHYRHNLDLLSHAYNWNKDYSKASVGWATLCKEFGKSYCRSYTSFLMATGKLDEAEKIIMERREDTASYYLVRLLKNPKDKATQKELYDTFLPHAKENLHLYTVLHIMLKAGQKLDSKEIEDAVAKSLSEAGFDSWSVSILNAQVYAYMADVFGHKTLAANLRLIAASVGFVCKGSGSASKK